MSGAVVGGSRIEEKRKKERKKSHEHGQSVMIAKGWAVEEGAGGINGDGWRLSWSGEHTVPCTDGVL